MQSKSPIRVLVVDDSSLMRSHICSVLIENGMITDTANNGQECLDKIERFRPDVITLDINMPVMDGIECLRRIMYKHPMPVVMVSSLTQKNAAETLTALDIGAVDYVAKPDGSVSLKLNRDKYMLVSKVINASKITMRSNAQASSQRDLAKPREPITARHVAVPDTAFSSSNNVTPLQRLAASAFDAVIIGVSTGGPSALQEIIPKLPANFPYPIVIAQHMPARFTAVFAERLDKISAVTVKEINAPKTLKPGVVYIAQGDANVEMYAQGNQLGARPDNKESPHIWRPSITKLVESALKVAPAKRLCFVQLTGMGNDGAQAMASAHAQGATTIAESEQTAAVYGMPKELVKLGGASMVLPNYDIAQALLALK
ncbi:chemotaxis-specific protein-glutamate methyltransferase CheB [Glaciecola sp. SC05]|uniref:chemotaxis-specific protein-glutamate methyltransferase CheB n=1 Tax=Glaciecola sp. SC05 TaxID=1987355 RepID=UPI0035279D52